ncbi:hypothetical protein [Ornithinimicrobium cavernae]|uniref:hypothetical protein n=1 Tax=Ornithinimicrobium cavernae TaxID=2666047 RepID=UPI0012B16DA7|nr:hypothetical protein [Ornithinimicrobium cavernae]
MRTVRRPRRLLVCAVALTALAGCGDGPSAREVQADHRQEADSARATLEAGLAVVAQAGTLVGSSVQDTCTTGQHNWKIDDPYDVRCTVHVRQAYQVTGDDFRQAANSVTDAFPACPDGSSHAEDTLREYWDELAGERTHNFPGPYRPDHLPSYRLGCSDTGSDPSYTVAGWVSLPVDEASAQDHEHDLGRACQGSDAEPCEHAGDSAREAWERAAGSEGWVVFVTGSVEYARTP